MLDAAMNTPMLLRYILNDNYFMKERLNDDYLKNYLFISSISLNETGWARAEMIMSLLNGPDEENKVYLKKSLLDMVNEFDGKETKLGSFDDDHAKKMLESF